VINKIATVALYVADQDLAVDFWTKCVGLEVRTRRPLAAMGSWIEIAPPGAGSCLVLYPKVLLPDWTHRKPSIVFECDDVHATVASMKARGVTFSQEPKTMQWGHSRPFSTAKAANTGYAAARRTDSRRSRRYTYRPALQRSSGAASDRLCKAGRSCEAKIRFGHFRRSRG
jgi:lactoylglutathione lyase